MKITKGIIQAFLLVFLLWSCNDDDDLANSNNSTAELSDLDKYTSDADVMMQAFFWDVPDGGIWWQFIENDVPFWAEAGIDRVWLPPFSKGASGGYSMGYDPADYFDLGEYDQYGSIETRFGNKEELLSLINSIHANNMQVIADIVINHNGGGAAEVSGHDGVERYTLFTPEAGTNLSGRFNRNWESFNFADEPDEGNSFYPERDLNLQKDEVQNELWKNDDAVAKYYKNELGVDGWRFDYVKGFNPNVVEQWNDATGNLYSVGENWDGNVDVLEDWVNNSGSKAFDFASFYNIEKAFDSKRNLEWLLQEGLVHRQADKAVMFLANHDTDDRDETGADGYIDLAYKTMAYAYMLTHAQYSTIFYSDYEQKLDKKELNKLIKISKTIAQGDLEILYCDKYEYIARRNGSDDNPGLIAYFNISSSYQSHTVQTNWSEGTEIYDYAGHTSLNTTPLVNENGFAEISVAPNSYAIWSTK